jgi:outer membrane lipoprotein LolB
VRTIVASRAGTSAVATTLLVALLATGCATVPPPAVPATGRTADPALLTQWLAKGRIALSAAGEGGSGSFVWQQRSERTELTVRGPLGAGGLRIVTDGTVLEVEDGAGQPLDGDAARAAIEQRLGVRLPLDQFRYWMLGVPAPGSDARPLSDHASGPAFTQDDWTVAYESFQASGPWSLPARFTASTADARVRILVDDWQLPPPGP